MIRDINTKYIVLVWGFFTGITVFAGGYLTSHMPYRNFWSDYLEFVSSDNFISSVLAFFVSIYVFALPISLNAISVYLKPYGDNQIINWFLNRWEVYYMRVIIPFIIGYVILLLFINQDVKGFGCLIVFGFAVYTLYMLFKYFKTIIWVSLNTGEIAADFSSETANNILDN